MLRFAVQNKMLLRLFDWKGILAFLVVAMPWYVYMYSAHGQAFLDGFLGLNNVTRATQSEHPEDNGVVVLISLFPRLLLTMDGRCYLWYDNGL